MKKQIVWALVALLLLYIGPSFSQGTEDEKYEQPQIDVITDADEGEANSPKSSKPKDENRHPEDTGPLDEASKTASDAPEAHDPLQDQTDRNEDTDGDPTTPSKRSKRKKAAAAPIATPEVISETIVENPEPVVEETPQEAKPVQEEVVPPQQTPPQQQAPKPAVNTPPPQPEPVQPPQQQARPTAPPTQGQPNVGQPGQPGQPGQQNIGQPGQGPRGPANPQMGGQQGNVNVQQGRAPGQNVNQNPTQNQVPNQPPPQQQQQQQPPPQQQPQQVNQQPPQQPPQQTHQQPPQQVPQQPPQQQVHQQAPQQVAPEAATVKPVQVSNERDVYTQSAPVKDTHEEVKPQKVKPSKIESVMDEDEYMRLLENEGNNNYLEQYTIYSDTFFSQLERFFRDSVFPVYTHVRSNPELSLGFSTLIVIYLINLIFKALGRLCRSKPKFVYNKEEAMSHADINNNFKKFVSELEALKKQIDANAKKAGNAPAAAGDSGASTVSATIPQNLQNDIAYIAQNISKNEESLNKIAKDKKQLDSFLFEFQKEVVESHKQIWNELYQLRKVFSNSKLTMSTSTLKARSEAKDLDDSKSLSSNPETNESRRDTQREAVKKSTEPRSRSVADSNSTNALRSRQPVQKERKLVQETEPERPVTTTGNLQNGNGPESHAPPVHHNREEETEVKSQPHADKGAHQGPFGKQQQEEETQPEVQIPTNLSDKAPTLNPFAPSTQAAATQGPTIGQNAAPTSNPGLPMPGKGIPFGVKGRPPVVKQPVIQTTFSGAPEPAVNSGAKIEGNTEVNSSRELKASTPTPVQNTMPPLETYQEKVEEKSTLPETDHAPEETKASEQLSKNDEAVAAGDEEGSNDANAAARGFIPPMRMGGPVGGPPGQRKAVIPNNKALPVPGKRPGMPPGANVFKGPPGNIPRPGGPMQIKQPQGQGQVQGEVKTGSQV